jgi:hypothetical protein
VKCIGIKVFKKQFLVFCFKLFFKDTNLSELAVGSRDVLTLAQMGTGETFSAPDLPQVFSFCFLDIFCDRRLSGNCCVQKYGRANHSA